MNEEVDQIEKNNTLELVPRLEHKNVIGTMWIFKNNLNENGDVNRNKAILVCKGYAQQEGIYFEETFALVARLEAIRIFLTFSGFQQIKVYQMDVEYSFLNGDLEEEVYIEKPEGFILGNDGNLFANLKRLYMVSNKLLGHGTIILTNIFINKVLQRDLLIVNHT